MTVKPSSFGKDPGFGYTLFLGVIGWSLITADVWFALELRAPRPRP